MSWAAERWPGAVLICVALQSPPGPPRRVGRKLLPKVGNRRPYLKLNPASLVRANLEASSRSFALGIQNGWLSANDVRRWMDLEPIGPEGDVYLTPTSMTPISEGSSDEDDDRQRAHALALVR